MRSRSSINDKRNESLHELLGRLGLSCKDLKLLDRATTHKSYAAETGGQDFERLEFFGDAVLKFVVAEHLFELFPDRDEGELTEICAVIISAKTLEAVAETFALGDYIRVGRGVAMRSSILACSMEAVLGAIYLDSKFKQIRPFIIEHFCHKAEAVANDAVKENYKAQLQEYTQARAQGTPVYEVLSQDGPAHDPLFKVSVKIENLRLAEGSGRSKKAAEQDAARAAMAKLISP